jgi:hypothetical protein
MPRHSRATLTALVAVALVVAFAWLFRERRPEPRVGHLDTADIRPVPPAGDPMPVLRPSATVDPRMPVVDSTLPRRASTGKPSPSVKSP